MPHPEAEKKKDKNKAATQAEALSAAEMGARATARVFGKKSSEEKHQETTAAEKYDPALQKAKVGKPVTQMSDDEVRAAASGGSLGAVAEKRKRGLK